MEPAYVLHHRPYRETSQLLEVIGRDHGRVGARRPRGARPKGPMAERACSRFSPCTCPGRAAAGCTRVQRMPSRPHLRCCCPETALMSAWYLNELLLAFTTRCDPHPDLFAHYAAGAGGPGRQERPRSKLPLRRFEIALLAETGYGLDASSARRWTVGEPLESSPARYYVYIMPDTRRGAGTGRARAPRVRPVRAGAQLKAIAARAISKTAGDLAAAKRLLRTILDHSPGRTPPEDPPGPVRHESLIAASPPHCRPRWLLGANIRRVFRGGAHLTRQHDPGCKTFFWASMSITSPRSGRRAGTRYPDPVDAAAAGRASPGPIRSPCTCARTGGTSRIVMCACWPRRAADAHEPRDGGHRGDAGSSPSRSIGPADCCLVPERSARS